jgi:predicted dehydrogenase
MLKIGIVGCGKIADQHVNAIMRIPGCEIVGVCDIEELMAKQMRERFNVKNYFSDVKKFLEIGRPDIVHITTPPQSHYELGITCLEAGCHVFVEKPFTLDTAEAERLIGFAKEKNLKITVDHDAQFTHAARRMREIISEGFLGGKPIHIESYYCYDLSNRSYAKALLGDRNHWVSKLPGKLLQNVISHGVSKIAEFLCGENPEVIAYGTTSVLVKDIGEGDIIDELRVIISDDYGGCTAYFTFSSQMRPLLHQLRIFGPKNGLIVDADHETVIKVKGTKYKSQLDRFVPPIDFAKEYLRNSFNNIRKFIRNDFHMDSGMRFLIESFYRSIVEDAPLPIPYREIILTSRIMDKIFDIINKNKEF